LIILREIESDIRNGETMGRKKKTKLTFIIEVGARAILAQSESLFFC